MADSTQNEKPASWLKFWRKDLLSSLVVFLVALPLCMGIALACGAPVASGLVTGIIGGLIVGLLAGSPLQVSGPAAGLTVVCGDVIRDLGLPALGIVVLIAGMWQILAGVFRLGQWFRAVSPAVVHGMLSGIGVLILSSQIHVMVDDRPRANGVQNIASLPEAIIKGFPMPTLEPADVRQARVQLLDTFGMLHERQSEIEHSVERIVSKHGSDELHEAEHEAMLALVPRQAAVIEDFAAAVDVYRGSLLADANVQRAERLQESMLASSDALEVALANLRRPPAEIAEEGDTVASQALSSVLGNLKSHDWAAKIGLFTIALIVLWQGLARGAWRLIPAPLLAIAAVTAICWSLSLPVLYVEVPDNLRDGLTLPSWAVLEDVPLKTLIIAGLLMAVIASAETLLCATAVDLMHNGPRTRYDRELAAQGIGNILCGSLGALPMTGVIVRSAANVQAGAQTRLSAFLHGLWLLVMVVAMASVLRIIPTAGLAGILVYTGYKLIDFKGLASLWRQSRSEALIFLTTMIVIVVEDLLIGVLTGVILSAIKLLVRFSHLDIKLSNTKLDDGQTRSVLLMSGAATFLRLPQLAAKLEEVPKGAELHVDFERLDHIDHACLELLTNWAKQHRSAGGRLVVDWDSLHARFAANGAHHGPDHPLAEERKEPADTLR